jgi:hypothetical protein
VHFVLQLTEKTSVRTFSEAWAEARRALESLWFIQAEVVHFIFVCALIVAIVVVFIGVGAEPLAIPAGPEGAQSVSRMLRTRGGGW